LLGCGTIVVCDFCPIMAVLREDARLNLLWLLLQAPTLSLCPVTSSEVM
jgi:hypothetical protein